VNAARVETVLYSFSGGSDGGNPSAGVILDSAGNLYGATMHGGSTNCFQSCGVVYEVDAAGQGRVLYSFTGQADGANPQTGVIRDSAGNLYGTAGGGASYKGVVFKLDSSGGETVLYTVTGGDDGESPYAGVVRDSAGNLYGTASSGGKDLLGVVFKIVP
jgi:uncharacterized repeat protein (TIGR03803 family)